MNREKRQRSMKVAVESTDKSHFYKDLSLSDGIGLDPIYLHSLVFFLNWWITVSSFWIKRIQSTDYRL